MNRLHIKLSFLLLTLFLIASCKQKEGSELISDINIIPAPQEIEALPGYFILSEESTFSSVESFPLSNNFFREFVSMGSGIKLKRSGDSSKADIVFKLDSTLSSEEYRLSISPDKLILEGADDKGIFYGVQTIRQLLPNEFEDKDPLPSDKISIPCVSIEDSPKFKYRGMHLDVGRHFFPKDFIKEYIDYLAMLKMNYFHWHLSEDQGWRIEIKQFPRLTTHAAYRDETLIGHYNDQPQQFDGERYGGFYTQEEVKEIVNYAFERNITIIPEIEMPGHAQAAVSAYPELGCTGKQVEVATKWGVFENIFCPNEKTFAFLEGVLTEVIDLFPGPYIHIGGDEAPKAQWKECSHCQKLIKEHNLGDENGLQSWFIERIERFVNIKGKQIIGWDEILEGGLAPNATVMSWRGVQGGIEAAREGHDVIMTPTSHVYFDYYQSDKPEEPLAIGGFLPLEKVYAFNPIPKELSEEEAKHILGGQGNVWTEYMKTQEKVQYMVFPRILAMSEVLWAGPAEEPASAYAEFVNRVENFSNRLDALGVNYANHLYGIEGKVLKSDDTVSFKLQTPTSGKQIRYQLNDSEWFDYSYPIALTGDSEIKALVYKDSEKLSDTFSQKVRFHEGILGKIALDKEPHPSYAAGGKEALNNGISGSDTRYGDSEWLGFWGEDLELTVEFDAPEIVNWIDLRFFHAPGQWIHSPEQVTVRAELENGMMLNTISEVTNSSIPNINTGKLYLKNAYDDFGDSGRIKKLVLRIPNFGVIPEGQQGAGNKAWTFIDEIIIE